MVDGKETSTENRKINFQSATRNFNMEINLKTYLTRQKRFVNFSKVGSNIDKTP